MTTPVSHAKQSFKFDDDKTSKKFSFVVINGHLALTNRRHLTDEEFIRIITLAGNAVTSVDLSNCVSLTDKSIAALKGRGIQKLNLLHCPITDAGLKALEKSVTHLRFSLGEGVSDAGLKAASELPLVELEIDGENSSNKSTDSGLDYLKKLKRLTSLTCKSLGTQFSTEAFQSLLSALSLNALHVHHCPTFKDICLKSLRASPLSSLALEDVDVSDTGIGHVKDKSLQHLHLAKLRAVTDLGLKHLSGCVFLSLSIKQCYVSDDGIPLLNLRALETFELSENYWITGAVLKCLINSSTRRLILGEKRIGDRDVPALDALIHLTSLDLRGTMVSEKALDGLQRRQQILLRRVS